MHFAALETQQGTMAGVYMSRCSDHFRNDFIIVAARAFGFQLLVP
jgi:hypothetical protein